MSEINAQASILAEGSNSSSGERCPLCPEAGPPTPPSTSITTDGDGDDEDLIWIACTRCSTWYHSVCILSNAESSETIPSKIRDAIPAEQGVWYNWTIWIDKWYCAKCISSSISPSMSRARRPRQSLTATIKRNFQPTNIKRSFSPSTTTPTPTAEGSKKRPRYTTDTPSIIAATATPEPTTIAVNENNKPESSTQGRPKRNVATIDYHNLNNSIATPTSQWLDLIGDPAKYGRTILDSEYKRIPGKLINRSWLENEDISQSGFSPNLFYGDERAPIIITPAEGGFTSLGGQLPGKDLTVQDVSRLVGPERIVHVIDVSTQQSSKWTLADWAKYVKSRSDVSSSSRTNKVYNIISLEISGTDLARQVKPPTLVREIDWVDNFWPTTSSVGKSGKGKDKPKEKIEEEDDTLEENKTMSGKAKGKEKVEPYPKVQLYCLMGMKGSWTDWHVDFAASSVYYTIHTGSKVFYFIRPTPENLKAYADWSGSYEKQQEEWLGDKVDEVRKVVLHAGDTMIIPSGYIHAVYTPMDSIVFGGNFIHSYNIKTQLRLRQIEIDTKVPQQFRFPMFDKLCWYVADKYCTDLRHLRAYRAKFSDPPHPHVLRNLVYLADFLISQSDIIENKDEEDKRRKMIFDRVPSDIKDPSGLARELKWRVLRELGDDHGISPSTNADGGRNTNGTIAKDSKHKYNRKGRSVSRAFEKKPISRTWQFDPPAWERIEYPVQTETNILSMVRPGSLQAGEEAEMTTSIHKQSRKRIREEKGTVIEEIQEEVFTEKKVIWHLENGMKEVKEEEGIAVHENGNGTFEVSAHNDGDGDNDGSGIVVDDVRT